MELKYSKYLHTIKNTPKLAQCRARAYSVPRCARWGWEGLGMHWDGIKLL